MNEVGQLRRVLMRRPRDVFVNQRSVCKQWESLGYLGEPDFENAVREHAAFGAQLEESGARVDYLPGTDALTLDAIYTRDAAVAVPGGLVLCRMGKRARDPEPQAMGDAVAPLGVDILGAIEGGGHLEGGDVVWLDATTLIVGRGYRTNDEGIRQLAQLVGEQVEVIVVPLPHWHGDGDVFHLMSMLSPVGRQLALVYSPLLPVSFRQWLLARDIRLVEVPDEEFDSMGCNVLALGPGRCVALAGNPRTRAALEHEGVEVLEYEGLNISTKGGGGPTCLTRPLSRDRVVAANA